MVSGNAWLHYDQVLDRAYCHTCVQAVKQGKVRRFYSSPSESTFLCNGYSNWKDASGEKHRGFKTHAQSQVRS